MSRITLKSQALIISQLEAQVAELTTTKGVLMNEVNALTQDNARLTESNDAAHKRCDELEGLLVQAVESRPVVKSEPRMTVAPDVIQSQPTVEITAQDRNVWAKFQALPREERLNIIAFARPIVGHVGIHNIIQVRAAWHQAQAA